MKRFLVLAAAAVVLVSNAWALVSAARNRSETTGGPVELTERELELPPLWGDSTMLFLRLRWDVASDGPEYWRSPAWLTVAKLGELGFDCRVPPTATDARYHYSMASPIPVYLVLEYEGEAWKTAPGRPEGRTHLFAVDAGLDAAALRSKYPDPARHIVTRAVVGLRLEHGEARDSAPPKEPRLRGRIQMLLPDQIHVPAPYGQLLQGLRRRDGEPEEPPGGQPRFAVKVAWGRNHEPWVQDVRLLTSKDSPRENGR